MKIIALDGASGTGKSVLIGRLKNYFEVTGKTQVRIERLLDTELENNLDDYKKSDSYNMRPAFCEALIKAYWNGYVRLRNEDTDYRRENNNNELIFILDRYLLSLYSIQGKQWGISNLHERCRNIPKPDGQFLIRLACEVRPEDKFFLEAADEWRENDFHGEIWDIQNKLSYNQNRLDNSGYNEVKDTIRRFLEIQN